MLNAEIVNKDEEIIKFVNELLEKAVKEDVSDVHIEPQTENTRVRFRKNGKLYVVKGYDNIPKQLHDYIIAQIKILTGTMRLDVKDRPQDGKIHFNFAGRNFVFRLLSYPTIHGESFNIFNMDEYSANYTLEALLNNDKELIGTFRRNIQKKEGLMLFTGPTTAGKSTFIHTVINELSTPDVKIRTIEDPVKMPLQGTDQMKFTQGPFIIFENYISQAVRGDVDILYIGGIRTYEAAHKSLEVSSLKGYKIISTLYTNDSISTLLRFEEMGIKRYMIASGMEFIVNLRRTKRLCPHCKEKVEILASEFEGIGLTPEEIENGKFYKAVGCNKCLNTGYTGILAIVETLEFTRTLKDAFVKGAGYDEIEKLAKEEGVLHTLADDTRRKFLKGDIDLEAARTYTM